MKEKLLNYILYNREKALKIMVAFLFLIIALFILIGKEKDGEILVRGEESVLPAHLAAESTASSIETEEKREIFVHLSGGVHNPGVLKLKEGTRIYEAIELAGGIAPGADLTGVNMARTLRDEEKLHIPLEGEAPLLNTTASNSLNLVDTSGSPGSSLVNINTADSSALQNLKGVGPATAAKIIEYRQHSGPFRTTEQIKEVSGIGEKTYLQFKDKICI